MARSLMQVLRIHAFRTYTAVACAKSAVVLKLTTRTADLRITHAAEPSCSTRGSSIGTIVDALTIVKVFRVHAFCTFVRSTESTIVLLLNTCVGIWDTCAAKFPGANTHGSRRARKVTISLMKISEILTLHTSAIIIITKATVIAFLYT